jgi:leucyl aminopeptidase (aminopeptidase T)
MLDYRRFAEQVLDICIGVRPGNNVWINAWEDDIELASELSGECTKRRCQTLTTVQFENVWTRSIMEAPIGLVDSVSKYQVSALKETDAYIFTLGPRMIPWDKIPPRRRNLVTRWFLERNRFVRQWKAIARTRKVKMLGIEATVANPERAKSLGLDYEEWRRVMFEGCMADYKKMGTVAKSLAKPMGKNGRVRITAPHGTDFAFNLDSRPVDWFGGIVRDEWVAVGRPAFLPAGGIEVSADEESGEGTVVFDKPILSLLSEGRVETLELTVAKGRIIKFSASTQQEAFRKWMRNGKGDKDRFGFFGFGLNPKLRHGFTQDDKVLGGVTIGFGDNTDKAGRNISDRGFWASMTKATVTIGDRLIMKEGRLLRSESR